MSMIHDIERLRDDEVVKAAIWCIEELEGIAQDKEDVEAFGDIKALYELDKLELFKGIAELTGDFSEDEIMIQYAALGLENNESLRQKSLELLKELSGAGFFSEKLKAIVDEAKEDRGGISLDALMGLLQNKYLIGVLILLSLKGEIKFGWVGKKSKFSVRVSKEGNLLNSIRNLFGICK